MEIAFTCTDMLGHLMPLLPYIDEISRRGHHVTLFLPNHPKYVQKIEEFGLKRDNIRLVQYEPTQRNSILSTIPNGGPMSALCSGIYDAMMELYKNDCKKPAVVVADFFTSPAFDAGDSLEVPVIVVYPNPLGLGSLGALPAPHLRTVFDIPRELACIVGEACLARILCLLRNLERSKRHLPSLEEQDLYPCYTMQRPMLSCSGNGFEYQFQPPLPAALFRSTGPTPFPLGSYPLVEGELSTWFSQQITVVYVAFGTMHTFNLKTARELHSQLQELCANFSKNGVGVLWSLPASQQDLLSVNHEGKSTSVRLESFVPQYAVLAHSKTAVFVTHCGANSVYEALLNSVPMVCCPTGKDQPANAARVVSSGAGVYAEGGVKGVFKALNSLLQPERLSQYQKKVNLVRKALTAQGGSVAGADFIEEVGRGGVGMNSSRPKRWSWSLWGTAAFVLAMGLQLVSKF
mmetsp:Transcript_13551/g.26285  ORF Transcript_13551/g.26285 Transcript_13551/m.26285 type:complete len:461 (+) Transcript_13551:43-1425(+)